MFGVLGIRAIKYQHPGIPCHLHASVFSVRFDSLAPARLALRANLWLLYLKGPAFSIVVNPHRPRPSRRLLRAADLPLRLIERDAYRCGQVQAPRVGLHGNRQTRLRIFPQ